MKTILMVLLLSTMTAASQDKTTTPDALLPGYDPAKEKDKTLARCYTRHGVWAKDPVTGLVPDLPRAIEEDADKRQNYIRVAIFYMRCRRLN